MTIIRVQNCGNCKSSVAVPGDKDVVECRRFPPTATAILVPAGTGRVMVNAHSSFPRIPPAERCDEWKPRLVMADAIPAELPG